MPPAVSCAGSKYPQCRTGLRPPPTRILVQEKVYKQFVDGFVGHTKNLKVGDGQASGDANIGPLANARRITAMETFIGDAQQKGATVRTGGHRIGNKGSFFEPTVMTDDADGSPRDDRGTVRSHRHCYLAVPRFDDAGNLEAGNRLPYGLA